MMITILAGMLQAAQPATPPSPPTPPPPCASEAHDDFDLWVGEWNVTQTGSDTKVADSKIERVHNGCVVREFWMPLQGSGGSSLNSIRDDGRWHQRWTGSSGETVDFVGGLNDAQQMVLTGYWGNYGGPGVARLVRMTYTKNDDGSVRQHGEISADHGTTWSTGFDLTYHVKDDAAE